MTCNVLLPVDGSESSAHAAQHVAKIAELISEIKVVLVSVQSPGDDWMIRRIIKSEELATMEQEWAEAAIAPAREILTAAGIKPIERIVQGDVAQSIVKLAKECGCDQIIMGTRGQSALAGLLIGSIATKVLHLSNVPVTLVK